MQDNEKEKEQTALLARIIEQPGYRTYTLGAEALLLAIGFALYASQLFDINRFTLNIIAAALALCFAVTVGALNSIYPRRPSLVGLPALAGVLQLALTVLPLFSAYMGGLVHQYRMIMGFCMALMVLCSVVVILARLRQSEP